MQATKKYEQPAREYGPARHTMSSGIASNMIVVCGRNEEGFALL